MLTEAFRLTGTRTTVHDDNIDKALRKFKKKVNDNGILQTLRDREFYEKPTTRRKRLANVARNRWLKKLEAEALPKKLY